MMIETRQREDALPVVEGGATGDQLVPVDVAGAVLQLDFNAEAVEQLLDLARGLRQVVAHVVELFDHRGHHDAEQRGKGDQKRKE